MRVIKLVLEDLEVESFATAASVWSRGTVLAHDKTDVQQTVCCATYAPYVCPSAADECPTGGHAWTECSPECESAEPYVCGGTVGGEL